MSRRKRKTTPEASPGERPETAAHGDSWHPVPAETVTQLAEAAIIILTTIGMAEAPPVVCDAILAAGGRLDRGRLLYPRALIEATLAEMPRRVLLAGQDPAHDLSVGGTRAYAGTGGAAPNVMDAESGDYRPSRLADLYDAARLADALEHVHFFARSLVAGDVADPLRFDLATAAAALAGTAKHVMVQATEPGHVAPLAELCHRIAGGEAAFRARPFLSLNINHAVPPLRFHAESAEVMAEAVRAGIPMHCNVFGQLGASSPVTLAGSVAQTLAETLAGLAFVHALDPNAPRIAGPRPMITDLRSGGLAGGAGEQAMATGLAVQVLRFWDLPCSVIAGATDSKLPDFQSGYEKALTINTALQAGANLITQAAGSQAGLMAVHFGAMVADNDMLGAILRANIPPEITPETLALEAIAEVVRGEGHFLGRPETYARMRSDFLYPEIADRAQLGDWALGTRADMGARASARAITLLGRHWPNHLSPDLRADLAHQFGLPVEKEPSS
ncbi:trimethylamine methyltransferase family protein [Ruegeria pomeroyi]|uniref:Methyltransferase n=1 Tax=Ruegeria pomeroyi TaxID=89184 RepID=A0A9Q3ZNR3_9RHOB|nr:trimethylamine methyltransferase family protein [Ruegeria pomeroyi]MCE8539400.1 trimethylamine methyltransferase family protein [Ruegeria pomeroyi]